MRQLEILRGGVMEQLCRLEKAVKGLERPGHRYLKRTPTGEGYRYVYAEKKGHRKGAVDEPQSLDTSNKEGVREISKEEMYRLNKFLIPRLSDRDGVVLEIDKGKEDYMKRFHISDVEFIHQTASKTYFFIPKKGLKQ